MDPKNIRPMGENVLVRLVEPEKRTASGIVLPDSNAKQRGGSRRATVLAVGPGRVTDEGRRIEPHVKRGDVVIIGTYDGASVAWDDGGLLMVKEAVIQAVEEG